jgi:two-component system, OmpR family, sensor kinase
MKVSNPFIKRNSIKFQLMFGFAMAMIMLILVLEVSQYLNMKNNLYQSKVQLLESRFNNIDIKDLLNTKDQKSLIENADNFISMAIGEDMSVSIIDKNGKNIRSSNQSDHDVSLFIKKNSDTDNDSATNSLVNKKRDATDQSDTRELIAIPILDTNEYIKLMKLEGTISNNYRIVVDSEGVRQMLMWSKIGDLETPAGLIQVSIRVDDIDKMLQNQLSVYLLASLFVIILGGVFSHFIINRTLRPLNKMTSTVEGIDVDQLSLRLPSNIKQVEVDRLSDSFNGMLDRLEASFHKEQQIKEKMHQFVSNASHELRTPLTSIHGFAEVLQMGAAKDPIKLELALNSILTESDRLTALVNELLMLTRLDSKLPISMTKIELGSIIKEIHPQLMIMGGRRTIKLCIEDEGNVLLFGNENQIKQIIINLVHNAIQHTDEETGEICITATLEKTPATTEGLAVLEVSDNGTGILKEHLDDIFDRFFRSESHRSRQHTSGHGGYGLGLSIVKSLVEAHDGTIEVQSEYGNGTTFIICFKNGSIR